MVNNMDHGLPKFSLLGYDDWKIMMEAHLYALHDCMWMVLEDGPLKIQMENPERNPATPDVVKKPGHWKSACPYPKVEKYGERERNEKKKKAMVAAESDESSSSSSDEEALVCMECRVEKSNHEDRWTMSEDDTLCLMSKDDTDQEVTSQTSCSSSYSITTSENLFDQFKKMMKDFEEINLKHSSLTEENKLLSEENLKFTESRKSQLNEITQLKTENESLSEKVKSLDKELGILKVKEAVKKLLETTKHKGRKGLGFDPSSSKRKGKTTFIPPKPTAKPNKQKGKEKEKPTEVPKKVVPPKNYRKLDRPQKGNNFRRKPSNPQYTRGYTHHGVDRSFPRNSEWRTMPRYSHPPPQKLFVPPKYAYNRHRSHYAQPRQNYRSYQPRFARRKQEIAPPARKKFYAYNYDYNPNKFRATRKISCNFKLDVGTNTINHSGPKLKWHVVDKPSKHEQEVLDLSDKDEEVNEGDRMKPTELIPFRSLPLKTSQRNPDSNSAEPSNIPDHSNGDNSRNGDQVPIHPETPTTSVLQPEAELDQPVNPNQHNLRWLRDHPPQQVIGNIQSGVRTRSAQQNLEAMLASADCGQHAPVPPADGWAYVPPLPPPPPVVVVTIEKLKKNGAEEFCGDQIAEPMAAKHCLERVSRVLGTLRVPAEQRGDLAIALLQDVAYDWWKRAGANIPKPVPWATFDELFREEYVPEHFMEEKRDEFMKFTQGELTLPEYHQKFDELAEFGWDLVPTMEKRCKCFREGLRPDLSSGLVSAPRNDINDLYKQALELQTALLRKAEYEQSQTTHPRPPPPSRSGSSSKRPPHIPSSSHSSKKVRSAPAASSAPTQKSGKSQSQSRYRNLICNLCGRRHSGECWFTQGNCLGCGQAGHYRRNCPRTKTVVLVLLSRS
ncbi:unnamed protein product [Cuscuta campestris]|uniref:CCHC-type domain-containing protein n=1 Tax=Cuscuta campestris TaxID=132261 RepID=A0A484MA97_9ASTE|nr:unnamed protein product [Cuscuta campestris]